MVSHRNFHIATLGEVWLFEDKRCGGEVPLGSSVLQQGHAAGVEDRVEIHSGGAVGRVVDGAHVGHERLDELGLLRERRAVAELDPDDGAVHLQVAGEAGDDSGVPSQLDRHQVDGLACAVVFDRARHVDVAVGVVEGAGESELT